MMRAPVAVAMRPASASPSSRTARSVSMSIAGSPERRTLAQRAIDVVADAARAAIGATAATPSASFHAVSAGRMSVATWPGACARPRWRPRRRRRSARAFGEVRTQRRDGPRDALDVRGQGRVVLDVVRGVLAHDVDDARAGLAGVVEVGQAVAEAGAQVQQRGRGPVGHAPVAVGRAGDHALEEAEHAADAVDLVEGGHEVHLRGARIGEAHVDSARHQRSRQAFRPVHPRLRFTLGIAADRSVCAMRGRGSDAADAPPAHLRQAGRCSTSRRGPSRLAVSGRSRGDATMATAPR